MARVSARVIFVCRVVLRETLSVDWRERRLMGRTPSVTACRLCQLPRRGRPWQRGQVSSSFVNGRKKPAVKLQTFRLCQSLSLSGEVARRSRDGEGCLPGQTLSVAYGDSSPKGRALGKEGRSRPHSSTAGRSQPISGKLSAFAKASPFRERWHGKAVTERVSPRLAAAFGKHFSQSESGQNRKKRLCRRHTARFCPGDLHFGVQGGTLVVPPAHRK